MSLLSIHGRKILTEVFHSNGIITSKRYFTASQLEKTLNKSLPSSVKDFVVNNAKLCQPDDIHICDGSEAENRQIINELVKDGVLKPLHKHDNCYLARTDPADVARVESKTVISTEDRRETIPEVKDGVTGKLGIWMSPENLNRALNDRFPGCMKGRKMFVVPFSMGPIGGPLSKVGVELTDSPYVVASMRIMTRMGAAPLDMLADNEEFVKCLHTVGQPLPMSKAPVNAWPCNPSMTLIAHKPDYNEIASFGSGYGGNSLLGKKCLALRLGSVMARRQGWLAEHMLILGITNPEGRKKYIAAAFPSACGKTNLAMMLPTLPGYKVECVGDDIAWMKFDSQGHLRAINPEAGFFGVAPGTSTSTNPNAMASIQRNTLFTNVAETRDGDYYWEGLEKERDISPGNIIDWTNKEWTRDSGRPAAHPNSRFCCPASQCPSIDPKWESPDGVPIEAIIFGGRRPKGVPLIYEAFSWSHGVFVGASMRSESTAAAEHKGKVIMHDPFAMRPFFGYNFGKYLDHWLSFQNNKNNRLPRVYHVNWFRKDEDGKFIWPGFGENSRVLDWIFRRLDGEDCAHYSPIGHMPRPGSINTEGLNNIDMNELFSLPGDFWRQEANEIRSYFEEQVGDDLPTAILEELINLETRAKSL